MPLADALLELQELTEQLRRECPWDREQTAKTIVPHTVEEAYEVADAALASDDAKLLDELGELRRELERTGAPAPETEPDPAVEAEFGDVLFTVVNLARRLNVDPELALRQTTQRFVGRVEEAQRLAAERGDDWAS